MNFDVIQFVGEPVSVVCPSSTFPKNPSSHKPPSHFLSKFSNGKICLLKWGMSFGCRAAGWASTFWFPINNFSLLRVRDLKLYILIAGIKRRLGIDFEVCRIVGVATVTKNRNTVSAQ